ncbi:MAG: toxin-antitoxin system YwqK family antitoxin [Bacteroidia bacterium]
MRPRLSLTLALLWAICLIGSGLKAQTEFSSKHDSINWVDSKGLKQGKFRKADRNGKTIYEGYFRNDKPFGIFHYYDEDGKVTAISVFSKDAKSCHTTMFDRNGAIMAKGRYVNQLRDSVWTYFNADTQMVARETYLAGKKNGACYNYFAGGVIAELSHWEKGVEVGEWKEYNPDGKLKGEGVYVKGCLEGKVTYYCETGDKRVECYYKGCLPHGQWVFYKCGNGAVDHIVVFKNGKVIGDPGIDLNKLLQKNEELNRQDQEGGATKNDGNGGY